MCNRRESIALLAKAQLTSHTQIDRERERVSWKLRIRGGHSQLGKSGVDCARTGEVRKDNARNCAQRADGMDTEAAQKAKKGERERKREAPKKRLSEGQEKKEVVEEEGEPEKDTLSHSTVRYCRVFPVTVVY